MLHSLPHSPCLSSPRPCDALIFRGAIPQGVQHRRRTTLSVHQLLGNTDERMRMDIKDASVVFELLWMLLQVLLLLLLIDAAYLSWLLLLGCLIIRVL
jgi:hypothetical protein